jgi:hypothetical protein
MNSKDGQHWWFVSEFGVPTLLLTRKRQNSIPLGGDVLALYHKWVQDVTKAELGSCGPLADCIEENRDVLLSNKGVGELRVNNLIGWLRRLSTVPTNNLQRPFAVTTEQYSTGSVYFRILKYQVEWVSYNRLEWRYLDSTSWGLQWVNTIKSPYIKKITPGRKVMYGAANLVFHSWLTRNNFL